MLKQLKKESKKLGLKMNLSKTKVMTERNIRVELDGYEIEEIREFDTWYI